MENFLKTITDNQMAFCTGVAVLAVQVPPHWETWLAGELGEMQMTLWVVAAAAIVRGVISTITKIMSKKEAE